MDLLHRHIESGSMVNFNRERNTESLQILFETELKHFKVTLPEDYILAVWFLEFNSALEGFAEEYENILMQQSQSSLENHFPMHLVLSMDELQTDPKIIGQQPGHLRQLADRLFGTQAVLKYELAKAGNAQELPYLVKTSSANVRLLPTAGQIMRKVVPNVETGIDFLRQLEEATIQAHRYAATGMKKDPTQE